MSKKSFLAGIVLVFCTYLQAGIIYNYTVNQPIPDGSIIGLTDAHIITGLGSSISDVLLTVNLSGIPGVLSDLTTAYIRLGNLGGSPSINLTPVTSESFSLDLTSFQGLDPNTTWTIFFADRVAGGQTTLTGWSLDITAVPEPVNVALGIFAGVFAVGGLCRTQRARNLFRRSRVSVNQWLDAV